VSDVDEFCPSPDARMTDVSDLDLGRFRAGDRVKVRSGPTHATDNPRTPAYTVGATGTVIGVHGVVINPMDHHLAYPPMYSVRFEAREMFGTSATHAIIAEVHEEWLDPA
jgi:hypothetical protein